MKYLLTILTIIVFLSGCNTTPSQPTEGYVQLQFDITEEGATDNIKVIKSVPSGFFDEEAKKSLSKWKYTPKVVNGVTVRQVDLKVQLDFTPQK
jgi:TonB family protein